MEWSSFISQNTLCGEDLHLVILYPLLLILEQEKFSFGKNGVFKDSSGNTGDPANGTNPTFSGLTTDGSKDYGFNTENRSNIANGTHSNFGLGYLWYNCSFISTKSN